MRPRVVIPIILLAIVILVVVARRAHQQLSAPVGTNDVPAAVAVAPSQTAKAVETPTSTAGNVKGTQARLDRIQREVESDNAMWKAPLIYVGKVVDESNQPISTVHVSFSASAMDDSGAEVQNTGAVESDNRGFFKIDGVRGINLMVQLSHSNYYSLPDNPTGFDKRAMPRKGYFSDSEDTAEIFRMHSKGRPVALIHRRGGADVPVDSSSVPVNIYGAQDGVTIGTLQISASGNTPKNWSATPYDWSARLAVPGGGLVEFTNQFDFVAPDSGYQESVKIDMNKNQPGWSDTINKSFFVKLQNGFLRMSIHIRAKTPVYTSLEYFYNPDGSQNLEPAQ